MKFIMFEDTIYNLERLQTYTFDKKCDISIFQMIDTDGDKVTFRFKPGWYIQGSFEYFLRSDDVLFDAKAMEQEGKKIIEEHNKACEDAMNS